VSEAEAKARRQRPPAITLRMTAQERDEIKRRAHMAGLSVTRYVVESGLRGRPPKLRPALPPDPQERAALVRLMFELSKGLSNLNQLSRAMNAARRGGRGAPAVEAIESAAHEVGALVGRVRELL
jgi:hypothetical protein